jgi:hypothetical protein
VAAARRYVELIEMLLAVDRCPTGTVDRPEARPVEALVAGDLDRFWDRALDKLKVYCEASETPAAGHAVVNVSGTSDLACSSCTAAASSSKPAIK